MPNRRRFLQGVSAVPFLSGLGRSAPALVKRDYFAELGVRPFINAAGTYTALTASLMAPEVMQAIDYSSKYFVHLSELHDRVGERIASLIGCEAALVSAGAASALTLGTAACMTGTNEEFIRRLPDTAGMKSAPLWVRPRGAELRNAVHRGRVAR
jgi:D-glucosaminate-6-phosphate ammonia-lyase